MALVRPRLYWQAAFNANPNDRFAVPLWTDISHMYKRLEGPYSSGSQYELAQAQASQPSIRWFDPNEYLNPVNTGGPYYPDVMPLRKLLGQAVYPPAGTGNLLNANSWRPNDDDVYDPSFESYANGATLPDWIAPVGGVTGSITTTNPQQGTKSATYTVAANATPQGLVWDVPCVPGQQYTTSAYVRQSSASIQWLRVDNQTLAYDDFDRSASSGWGTATFGGAYTTSGGSASDYSVSSGVGRHSVGTLNVRRFTILSSGIVNFDETVTVTVPAVVTGGATDYLLLGQAARFTSSSNYYSAAIRFMPNRSMVLVIDEWVGGAQTTLDTYTLLTEYVAGSQISIRFQGMDTTLRARAWSATAFEPDIWQTEVIDTSHGGEGSVAYTSFATSGVTNGLPLIATFDNTMVTGSTVSSSTTTTGSYVRLSKTFTATQPVHAVSLTTAGTAVAGTVNIDAIQHEIGSSATAFTTTGAIVSPFMDGYVERWTREYEDQGFTGFAITPVIDSLAVANTISLDADYALAALAAQPNYMWRLDGQNGAVVAPEVSGAQNLLFLPLASDFGAGTAPAFGTAIDIPGAPSAPGVQFIPPSPPDSVSGAYTLLALGGPGAGVSWPRAYGATEWGLSLAVWIKATATSPATNQWAFTSFATVTFGAGLTNISPIFMYVNTSGHVVTTSTSRVNLVSAEGTTNVLDGVAHLVIATLTQVSGGNTVMSLYIDGTLENTGTVTTASLGGMYTEPATFIRIGASSENGFAQMFNGVLKYLSLWERALTTTEINELWTAGLGYPGELTGERLERRLRSNGYGGALRLSAGSSTMQATSAPADGLTEIHNVTNVEGGKSWSARDGALVFEGRQQRWLRITARGIFGEDSAGGEYPYIGDVQFDVDPTFTFANVLISRVNGAIVQGGTIAERTTAARKYFPRTAPQDTGDYETDELAQYKADWVFNTHKEALLRVSAITLDPSSNPALWPMILNLENNQRWTVKRRAKAANAGAGFTVSEDFFIEQITHNGVNMDSDQWTVTMYLSPVGLATSPPGVTFQPWILGDATYGVLGSTTVLGW